MTHGSYGLTQEEGHGLGNGREEHAGSDVAKDTSDLLVELLLVHALVPLGGGGGGGGGDDDDDEYSNRIYILLYIITITI